MLSLLAGYLQFNFENIGNLAFQSQNLKTQTETHNPQFMLLQQFSL